MQKYVSPRYQIHKSLDNQGGMGHVVIAQDNESLQLVAIKFCKLDATTDEIARFKREVRLLSKHTNSGFTIPILDHVLDSSRPYFVMPFADGDLTGSVHFQLDEKEKIILRMIECVEYLHNQEDFHRDIKPENFLSHKGMIVLSDLGLAKDPTSDTVFTKSIHGGGTYEYAPPSFFMPGGFKNPRIEDDIFSLGKTIYFVITGRVPRYIIPDDVPSSLYEVIRTATDYDQNRRYHNCETLRKDIISSFDMILNRTTQDQEYFELKQNYQLLDDIKFSRFMKLFSLKSGEEKEKVFETMSNHLFYKISSSSTLSSLASLLVQAYEHIQEYTKKQRYWSFAYAEQVANDIKTLCSSKYVSNDDKANGLKIAMDFAISMNRGAAAQTCALIIEAIENDSFAILASPLIMENKDSFLVESINVEACKHRHIIKIVLAAKAST